ncbi:uncharacterized protein N7477_004882 [Penicillium maclennaniae]|uniref:uncharacterized protein n=1 Tax=Penicillium maclennaniae TaxID=1343394 RepID=UPI002541EF77|nr:uncharacterized protein N7477_004882 [Penicillium maclennaniae]KAJ5674948.1 hypothetical protein N7477_004882 [Penicillium maclennaniae]
MTTSGLMCANWGLEQTACKKEGRSTCRSCYLIAVNSLTYCGTTCQKSHWPQHRFECESPVGQGTWQPAWVLEARTPAFMKDGIGETFGGTKYLWGDVPA